MRSRYWGLIKSSIILGNLIGIVICSANMYKEEHGNLDILNIVFAFVYLLEAIINIIATGLISGPKSYLHVGWNYIDIFIIITGLLSLIPPIRRMKICTILTMLRSIKITYTTKPMKRLMIPWFHSLIRMANVLIVLVFILMIYASAGVAEFQGSLYHRCRLTTEPIGGVWPIDETVGHLCDVHGYGSYTCPAGSYCGNPDDYGLEVTEYERSGSELVFYGVISFDNILKSFVACFQVITFDDWAKVMYRMQDSNGSVYSSILFTSLILIGSFFCLNLIVAMIVDAFQSHRAKLAELDKNKGDNNEKNSGPKLYNAEAKTNALCIQNTPRANSNIQPPQSPNNPANEERSDDSVGIKLYQLEELDDKKEDEKNGNNSNSIEATTKVNKEQQEDNDKEECCLKRILVKQGTKGIYDSIVIMLVILNLGILSLNRARISDKERLIYDIIETFIGILLLFGTIIEIRISNFFEYLRTQYISVFVNILVIIELILTWTPFSNRTFPINYSLFHQRDNCGI